MESDSSASILLLVLDFINLLVHSVGLYLLLSLSKGRHKTPQHLFLINLSISSITKNIFYTFDDVATIVSTLASKFFSNLKIYVYYTFLSAAYDFYLFSLLYLTCDRLMITLFHVRYSTVWNLVKTKVLLVCTAFLCLGMYLTTINVLAALNDWKMVNVQNIVFKISNMYVPTAFNLFFLIFATFSYLAMFLRYRKSRRVSSTAYTSVINLFRQSRFSVAIMLITSSLLLLVLPNMLSTISTLCTCPLLKSEGFSYYFLTSVTISDSVDGLIYVIFYAAVRNLFKNKVRNMSVKSFTSVHPSTSKRLESQQTSAGIMGNQNMVDITSVFVSSDKQGSTRTRKVVVFQAAPIYF